MSSVLQKKVFLKTPQISLEKQLRRIFFFNKIIDLGRILVDNPCFVINTIFIRKWLLSRFYGYLQKQPLSGAPKKTDLKVSRNSQKSKSNRTLHLKKLQNNYRQLLTEKDSVHLIKNWLWTATSVNPKIIFNTSLQNGQ